MDTLTTTESFDWQTVDLDTLVARFGCTERKRAWRRHVNQHAVLMAQALVHCGWTGELEARSKGTQRDVLAWVWQGDTRTPAGESFESLLLAGPRVKSPLTISRHPPPTMTPSWATPGLADRYRGQVRQWMLERCFVSASGQVCAPTLRF